MKMRHENPARPRRQESPPATKEPPLIRSQLHCRGVRVMAGSQQQGGAGGHKQNWSLPLAHHPSLPPEYSLVAAQHQAGPIMGISPTFPWLASSLNAFLFPGSSLESLGHLYSRLRQEAKPSPCCPVARGGSLLPSCLSHVPRLRGCVGDNRGLLRERWLRTELTPQVKVGGCEPSEQDQKETEMGWNRSCAPCPPRRWPECPVP
nr:uncharacterized protein LOC102460390 [Pelodiscus sinensis]|eukprot:XP_006135596.1 uncharacterized protein LOC102460390 [Pelodiscus sinensis]